MPASAASPAAGCRWAASGCPRLAPMPDGPSAGCYAGAGASPPCVAVKPCACRQLTRTQIWRPRRQRAPGGAASQPSARLYAKQMLW
eukprot:6042820-Heterocapsa_arctica.AAC.1